MLEMTISHTKCRLDVDVSGKWMSALHLGSIPELQRDGIP